MKKSAFLLLVIICFNLNAQDKPVIKDTIKVKKMEKYCTPTTKIGKYSGQCSIPKNELSIQKSIRIDCSGAETNGIFVVTSFEFTTEYKGQLISLKCDGNKFSKEVIDELQRLYPKQILYFENVKAKGPDGSIRNHIGLTITVK